MTALTDTEADSITIEALRAELEAVYREGRAKDEVIAAQRAQINCYWNAMTYVHETVPMPRRERLDKLLGKTP